MTATLTLKDNEAKVYEVPILPWQWWRKHCYVMFHRNDDQAPGKAWETWSNDSDSFEPDGDEIDMPIDITGYKFIRGERW